MITHKGKKVIFHKDFLKNIKYSSLDFLLETRKKNENHELWPNFPSMEKAINLFLKYYGQPITIVGDYDVDGTTSTALLVWFFDKIKQPYDYIIPNRFIDGYGITEKIVEKISSNLIITVDNGTSAYEAIKKVKELGKEILILDHHAISQELEDVVLLNPFGTEHYYLCAAGVVFVFLVELNKFLSEKKMIIKQNLECLLDMVAVATVCDIVPLVGLNKVLVKRGIEKLNTNPQPAYKAIIGNSIYNKNIDTEFIGFKIGPLINAAGRIKEGRIAVEFLTNKDKISIDNILIDLATFNKERKIMESKIVEEALEQINENNKIIFVCGHWSEGVIGIVASRLKDKFNKPTCVMSLNGDTGKASLRSTNSLNIAKLIEDLKGIILYGGGHAKAGGFSIALDKIEELKQFLQNYEFIEEVPIISIDFILSLSAQKNFLKLIEPFKPWGMGNYEPICFIPNCYIEWTSDYFCTFSSPSFKKFKGRFFNLKFQIASYHLIGYVRIDYFFIIDFIKK